MFYRKKVKTQKMSMKLFYIEKFNISVSQIKSPKIKANLFVLFENKKIWFWLDHHIEMNKRSEKKCFNEKLNAIYFRIFSQRNKRKKKVVICFNMCMPFLLVFVSISPIISKAFFSLSLSLLLNSYESMETGSMNKGKNSSCQNTISFLCK